MCILRALWGKVLDVALGHEDDDLDGYVSTTSRR